MPPFISATWRSAASREGVEFRYFLSPSSFGTLYADYPQRPSTGDGNRSARSAAIGRRSERWSFYLNHQPLSPDSTFVLMSTEVSRPWYFRDFHRYNYYLNNYSQADEKAVSTHFFLAR